MFLVIILAPFSTQSIEQKKPLGINELLSATK